MRAGVILALIVSAVFIALYAPLLSKASEYLSSYRPAARKSVSVGGVAARANNLVGGAEQLGSGDRYGKQAMSLTHDKGEK